MKKLTEKEINDLAYQKAGSTSWCDSFSYSEGMKDLQKILFGSASPPIEVSKEEKPMNIHERRDAEKSKGHICNHCKAKIKGWVSDDIPNTTLSCFCDSCKQYSRYKYWGNEEKKSLSSITDEDAIEVAKMLLSNPSDEYDIKPEEIWAEIETRHEDCISVNVIVHQIDGIAVIGFNGDLQLTDDEGRSISIFTLKAYQYLQSRNYILPTYY